MWLDVSLNAPECKQVKSALVQTELSKFARQVATLPLNQSHGRTNPITPPTLVPETKLS